MISVNKSQGYDGSYLLKFAYERNYVNLGKVLLSVGADPDYKANPNEFTLLQKSILSTKSVWTKMLLQAGADTSLHQNVCQATGIQFAANWAKVEVIQTMLDNLTSKNFRSGNSIGDAFSNKISHIVLKELIKARINDYSHSELCLKAINLDSPHILEFLLRAQNESNLVLLHEAVKC